MSPTSRAAYEYRALRALLPEEDALRERLLAHLPRTFVDAHDWGAREPLRTVLLEELETAERAFSLHANAHGGPNAELDLWERARCVHRAERERAWIDGLPTPWPWWLRSSGRTVERAAFECGVQALASWVRSDGTSFLAHGRKLDARTATTLADRFVEPDPTRTTGKHRSFLAEALTCWEAGPRKLAAGTDLGLRILRTVFDALPDAQRDGARRANAERLTRSSLVRQLDRTTPLAWSGSTRVLDTWILLGVRAIGDDRS